MKIRGNLFDDIEIFIVIVAIFKHMSHAMMGDSETFRIALCTVQFLVVNLDCSSRNSEENRRRA